MEEIKYIIIPDVHGRTFWREAIEKYIDSDVIFIFLGDYLDPYEYEDIDDEYKELVDIVEYKKQYPDRFVLLFGNHDLHYLTRAGRGSRWDWNNSNRNEKFFLDNISLFQITYSAVINNKTFLFSHAGILKDWIYTNHKWFNIEVPDNNTEYKINNISELPDFNEMLKSDLSRENLYNSNDVAFSRGGDSQWGSIFWADVHEHLDKNERIPGIIQVFGHTQQEKDPVNYDNEIYCLDCRKAFCITASGNISSLFKGEEIPAINSEEEYTKYLDRIKRLSAFFW